MRELLFNFSTITNATEVILFEKATFLVIANSLYNEQSEETYWYFLFHEFVVLILWWLTNSISISYLPGQDPHRFEKISNVMKRFKLSCLYVGFSFSFSFLCFLTYRKINSQQIQGIELKMNEFHFCIQDFTSNSYIMIIMPSSQTRMQIFFLIKFIQSYLLADILFNHNLKNARKILTPFLTSK